jgi:hypothetical protein
VATREAALRALHEGSAGDPNRPAVLFGPVRIKKNSYEERER